MFTLDNIVRVAGHEARCTITIDGARHSFGIRSEFNVLGIEAISYFDIQDDTRRLIVISNYERDFVTQLCRYFNGEMLELPLEIVAHMP